MYSDIPAPAGAVEVCEWEAEDEMRYFVGSKWVVESRNGFDKDITVCIDGIQHADRPIERYITTAIGNTKPSTCSSSSGPPARRGARQSGR
jgi:hypothetical protein